jgi:hypothetical protein
MPRIRIPEEHWGEVWTALVEEAAGQFLASLWSLFILSQKKHIDALQEKNLPFEFVDSRKETESDETQSAY